MKTLSQQQALTWTVTDSLTNISEELSFKKSNHLRKRGQQRSIDNESLQMALEYGDEIFKQGYIFYVYGKKHVPKNNRSKKTKKNIIVVVSSDDNTIVTCYKNNAPFKHIKKKSKQLL